MSNFLCRVCGHDQWSSIQAYCWCTKCTTLFLKPDQFGNPSYIEDERQAEITSIFKTRFPGQEPKQGSRLYNYYFHQDRWRKA